MDRSFLILLVAVAVEVVGTSALKLTAGFTKPIPIIVVFLAYTVTFGLMSIAMKTIPINIVYAVWSGLGTASIAIVGWVFFREALTGWAMLGIGMIVGGVVVLHNWGMPHKASTEAVVSGATGPAVRASADAQEGQSELDDGRASRVEAVSLDLRP